MKSVKMKKKIMIVDDEPDVSFTVEFTLGDEDFDFISVENGEKCLELLENLDNKPDLILLDMMMPGISGLGVFNKLKENPSLKDIPVIFLTAKVDYNSENLDLKLGDDYIEKPYDPVDLKERVLRVLNKS
jgi:DNA-binding response OmpR family regulator